jgi:AhpD family alkylhydroperoxidase
VQQDRSAEGSEFWFIGKAITSAQDPKPSANLSVMNSDRKEPTYIFSDEQVAQKSALARHFLDTRTRLNENVDQADNYLVKRFYNLDHNVYLEGALSAKYKELMGLAASACLRCDDCINYHVIQSYRLGATRSEQEEAINVALVVGGSIVIPHLRRAYELLAELYAD